MANAIPNETKDWLLDYLLATADLRVVLIDLADYTYAATHDFLADIPAGARVAVSGTITGKTAVDGLLSGTVPQIAGVTGDPVEGAAVYDHTGSDATARIVAFYDTKDGGGAIAFTPNGSACDVSFPSGIVQL